MAYHFTINGKNCILKLNEPPEDNNCRNFKFLMNILPVIARSDHKSLTLDLKTLKSIEEVSLGMLLILNDEAKMLGMDLKISGVREAVKRKVNTAFLDFELAIEYDASNDH